ncbi:hypothetical protein B0T16DRAFT_148173 [Cercophora newfieldiana]|uniref:Uncharacterized protein n=1 Tax=Cercophora newfieldiana TaxID=92897 RepID=A0AA40CQG7_9PEZI|nr:hypothetical protein B0T16DRAFT_148173 [Cercophora newfieldiana]
MRNGEAARRRHPRTPFPQRLLLPLLLSLLAATHTAIPSTVVSHRSGRGWGQSRGSQRRTASSFPQPLCPSSASVHGAGILLLGCRDAGISTAGILESAKNAEGQPRPMCECVVLVTPTADQSQQISEQDATPANSQRTDRGQLVGWNRDTPSLRQESQQSCTAFHCNFRECGPSYLASPPERGVVRSHRSVSVVDAVRYAQTAVARRTRLMRAPSPFAPPSFPGLWSWNSLWTC